QIQHALGVLFSFGLADLDLDRIQPALEQSSSQRRESFGRAFQLQLEVFSADPAQIRHQQVGNKRPLSLRLDQLADAVEGRVARLEVESHNRVEYPGGR